METKKSKKANLENKRVLFLEIGFVIALALIFLGFQWTKSDLNTKSLGALPDLTGEEEIVPITRQELQKPVVPPKPPAVILELNIVDNDVDLDDDIRIEDFEASQDEAIKIIEMPDEEEVDEEIFYMAEDMPLFRGTENLKGFSRYIQENIKYPIVAEENRISGTVYVNFVINKKGELTNIEIIRGVDPSIDNEVIRALKAAPKWTPGYQWGKPVLVAITMPVKFAIAN